MKEYLVSLSLFSIEVNVKGEMVFVGYGIVVDELFYNDYEDLDVKGKVVVVFVGKLSDFLLEEGVYFVFGY